MKTEFRYGFIFALIVVAYVMIEHFAGVNTTRHDIGQYSRIGGALVPILGVFFGIRAKRRELAGGMSWAQGVRSGALVAVTQTILTTIWFYVYATFVNPQFMDTMLEYERSKMATAGMSSGEVGAAIDSMRNLYSFPTMQIFQLVIGILYGTVFAMIFSAFLRKKPVRSAPAV